VLVTIVGSDGAGKSTVSRLVTERLEAEGRAVDRVDRWDVVDNPQYPLARFIRPEVRDIRACLAEMENPSRFLFMMWLVGHAVLGRRASAAQGATTLLDGYWMKHAASEIAYGLDPEWTRSVVAGLPQADLIIYLRLDPKEAWQRKQDGDLVPYECGMDKECSQDSFIRHQRKIGATLEDWSTRFGWTEIDASAPLAQVVETVLGLAAAAADAAEAAGRNATSGQNAAS
jgi:dTMP kinase